MLFVVSLNGIVFLFGFQLCIKWRFGRACAWEWK